MRIADIGLMAAIKTLLPHFVTAGKLACRVQDDIVQSGNRNGDVKSGDRFTEALTDADIAVETFLATQLLGTFEDAAFYGEEYERDRVSAYFPKDAPYLVTLDPIDGTLYFKEGLPVFSTIMTICANGAIEAAIVYLPREGLFYGATRKDGAWTTTDADVAAGKEPAPYRVPPGGKTLLVGRDYFDRREALQAAGFETINPSSEYDGSKDWWKTSVRMLSGQVCGMVYGKAQLIDACAIAFVAAQAGGKDNAPVIDPVTKRAEPLIVATSPETYEKIQAVLRG